MVRHTIIVLWAGALFGACRPSPSPSGPSAPPARLFCHEVLGLCFDVPADWQTAEDCGVVVISGPADTDAFFTTITLQGMADEHAPLDVVLDDLFVSFAASRRFRWLRREPFSALPAPALFYDLEFDLDDSLRRRTGLLLTADGLLVDVAYSAIPSFFSFHLDVLDRVIASLLLSPGASGPAPTRDSPTP